MSDYIPLLCAVASIDSLNQIPFSCQNYAVLTNYKRPKIIKFPLVCFLTLPLLLFKCLIFKKMTTRQGSYVDGPSQRQLGLVHSDRVYLKFHSLFTSVMPLFFNLWPSFTNLGTTERLLFGKAASSKENNTQWTIFSLPFFFVHGFFNGFKYCSSLSGSGEIFEAPDLSGQTFRVSSKDITVECRNCLSF